MSSLSAQESSDHLASCEDRATESCQAPESMAASPGASILAVSVGQRLLRAREERGLSLSDVGKSLKLSPHQIEALESDDWSKLPCNTIIRGFIRNYARLLGLDTELLMRELDHIQSPPKADLEISTGTKICIPQDGKVDRRDYLRLISGVFILVLAVALYFFLPPEFFNMTISRLMGLDTNPAEKSQSTAVKAEGEHTVTPPSMIVLPESFSVTSHPAESIPEAQVTPVPETNSGATVLKFRFSQPSWVEIRDRSGEIIFSQLNSAGSQREVEGRPPFNVVIGNAAHVSLQYKGNMIDLSKRSKDEVARVTLD